MHNLCTEDGPLRTNCASERIAFVSRISVLHSCSYHPLRKLNYPGRQDRFRRAMHICGRPTHLQCCDRRGANLTSTMELVLDIERSFIQARALIQKVQSYMMTVLDTG
jgi:hypothetical protein